VREQPVIANGEPEAGEQPHSEKQASLEPADRSIEQQAQRNQRADKRQYVEYDEVAPLQPMKVPALDYPDIAHFRTGNDLDSRQGIST
jgi:hypothetical protein